MNTHELSQKIEAILFYTAEAVGVKELVKILAVKKEEVEKALQILADSLSARGLRLIINDGYALLSTAPEYADTIEALIKEEHRRDLGRAGMETLAIIAYKGPLSKKEIEYIRGVNSDYAIRTLLLRGLIEKDASRGNERSTVYAITLDTLQYLGINKIRELPEYTEVRAQLEAAEKTHDMDEDIAEKNDE